MKRNCYAVCAFAAATLLTVTGCSGKKTVSGTGSSIKEITIAEDSQDGSLDPAGFALASWVSFSKLCSVPLLSYDKSGTEIMEAAESYTVSDDNLTWTFKLRPEGKWSDGSQVTAGDFINTVRRALDPSNSNSIYGEQLYVIAGAEAAGSGKGSLENVGVSAPDDLTLVFHLTAPCPYFKKLLALPVYYPSKAGVATAANQNWYKDPSTCLCNGAYKLAEFIQDQSITVEKNPYYYNKDKVLIEKIKIQYISDSQARIAAYESGEVNVVTGLPDYIETKYAGKPDLSIWHMLTTTALLPNEKVKPLDDVRVRQALALALNRTDICTAMGKNYEPSYSWVPKYMMSNSGSSYYSDERPAPYTEDTVKAQQLLAAAGFPGGKGFPVLTYIYPGNDKDAILAQAVQAQLKKNLGIDIKLQAQEQQVYNATRRDRTFELLRFGWTADFNDPINYLSLFTSDSSLNWGNVNDSAYDELISKTNNDMIPSGRNEDLHKASDLLLRDKCYIIPIETMHYIGLRTPSITGITYNDKDEAYYRFADIK